MNTILRGNCEVSLGILGQFVKLNVRQSVFIKLPHLNVRQMYHSYGIF